MQTAAAVATTKGAADGASKVRCAPGRAGAGPREGLGYKSGVCVRVCAWVGVGCLIKGGVGPKGAEAVGGFSAQCSRSAILTTRRTGWDEGLVGDSTGLVGGFEREGDAAGMLPAAASAYSSLRADGLLAASRTYATLSCWLRPLPRRPRCRRRCRAASGSTPAARCLPRPLPPPAGRRRRRRWALRSAG